MAKKNTTAKQIAKNLLKVYPNQNKVWITSDGQGFFIEGAAINNAKNKDLENPEVFFREGHQDEDNTAVEELLQETEEALKKSEIALNRVIDVSNTEAEDVVEVIKTDHEAVKNAIELRKKYEDAVAQGASFKQEVKEELEFNDIELKQRSYK